jgi:hypothetical protein
MDADTSNKALKYEIICLGGENAQYEISNGIIGLKRDIISKLVKIGWKAPDKQLKIVYFLCNVVF